MKTQSRVVYFNGRMVPESEARISIYDSALMFGDMVFEMTRSFDKKQFKLGEHINRLYAGIKILQIPLTMTPEEMVQACHETVEANEHLFEEDDEHRLMIDVSRGLLGIYEGIEGMHQGPNIIIADFPIALDSSGDESVVRAGGQRGDHRATCHPGQLVGPENQEPQPGSLHDGQHRGVQF